MMRLTIVTPTYNRAKIISRAIDSTVTQSFRNWEMIVVDDGSEDDTQEVVGRYCQNDQRIKYIRLPTNRGFFAARNVGIGAAIGQWISFLDSDDEFLPGGLRSIVDTLSKVDEEIDLVYFSTILRDKEANIRRVGYRRNEFWREHRPSYADIVQKHYSFDMHRCVKTTVAKKNPFSEDNPGLETAHYASLAKKGYQFKYVNQVVVQVNRDQADQHSDNLLKKLPTEFAETYIGFIKEHYDVLRGSERLFDLKALVFRCYWHKKDVRFFLWFVKVFIEDPKRFLRIGTERVINAFRFLY